MVSLVLGAFGLWLLLGGGDQPEFVVAARPNDDPSAPFVFDPETIEVPAGSTVRWVNGSETFHTVTFSPSMTERVGDGTFSESIFEEGAVIERTFGTTGDFTYFCQPHASFMAGQIVVVDPSPRRAIAGVTSLVAAAGTAVITLRLTNPAARLSGLRRRGRQRRLG